MRYNPRFGSHLPLLNKIMDISNGLVLELGIGLSSTPFLHWLCLDKDRGMVSYEGDGAYYRIFKYYRTPSHKIIHVTDWDKIDIEHDRWSVVLVDHSPHKRRRIEAVRVASNADFVILHDTEPEHEKLYGYNDTKEGAFPRFKYSYTYTKHKPFTSVLSNRVDVGKILYGF